MNVLIAFFCWCLLFLVCWPLAILALILAPAIWLISLPFRVVFLLVEGIFALLKAIVLFPARLLGRGNAAS